MKVMIYNEYLHEREEGPARDMYPRGIHGALSEGLAKLDESFEFSFCCLENHEEILTEETLKETEVLVWWGHVGHHLVSDAVVERVCEAVNKGMGLVMLHSGHESKVFRRLMGTRCSLHWYVNESHGRIWLLQEDHPICRGVSNPIEIPVEETYAEPFDVPEPDELLGITWWEGGEIFRGMNVYRRGIGKVFYFHPGHETFGSYYEKDILRVIANAVRYVRPERRIEALESRHVEPKEAKAQI